jgi:hypothetical protein
MRPAGDGQQIAVGAAAGQVTSVAAVFRYTGPPSGTMLGAGSDLRLWAELGQADG